MTTVLDFPYSGVHLSKALSTAEETALVASGITLTGLSVTSGNITVASQTVAVHDLKAQCRFIRPIERVSAQDVTSVDASVRREIATIPAVEIQAEFYMDDDDDGVLGVIVADRSGTRLLHIDATSGQKYSAVVEIFDVERTAQAPETGAVVYAVTMRNVGRVLPKWES